MGPTIRPRSACTTVSASLLAIQLLAQAPAAQHQPFEQFRVREIFRGKPDRPRPNSEFARSFMHWFLNLAGWVQYYANTPAENSIVWSAFPIPGN
jgi:hypothetical protein